MNNLTVTGLAIGREKHPENGPVPKFFTCYSAPHYYYIHGHNLVSRHNNSNSYSLEAYSHETILNVRIIRSDNCVGIVTEDEIIIFNIETQELSSLRAPFPILEAKWDYIGTSLAVYYKNGDVVVYNFDATVPSWQESARCHIDDVVPDNVYVGWGSRETQFRGRVRELELVEERVPQPYAPPKISWRGNGEAFVVNYWKDGHRTFKVLNTRCEAIGKCVTNKNLTSVLDFKPEGNKIATVSFERDGSQNIIIFEQNGLEKMMFDPEIEGEIVKIKFHPEVAKLAVQSDLEDGSSTVSIFVLSNACWELKQHLYFPPDRRVYGFEWRRTIDDSIYKLTVFTKKEMLIYTLISIIDRSEIHGIIGVVSGKTVYFTNYQKVQMPPGMSSLTFEMEHPVNRVCFHSKRPICFVFDTFYTIKILYFRGETYEVVSTINSQFEDGFPLTGHKIEWNDNKLIVQFDCRAISTYEDLNEVDLEIETVSGDDGSINFELSSIDIIKKVTTTVDDVTYEFTLYSNRKFMVNNIETPENFLVGEDVTSFQIFQSFVVLTSANSRLFCTYIQKEMNAISLLRSELCAHFERPIDAGMTIVCVTKDQITLQAPRGNIETVSCRLISIAMVEENLSKGLWMKAVQLIKEEKLNYNLLIDLNPARFSDKIVDFTVAVEEQGVLNTACSEFTSENVSRNLYPNCFTHELKHTVTDKLSVIKSFLQFLITVGPIKNFVPIILIKIKQYSLREAMIYMLKIFKLIPHSVSMIKTCKEGFGQLKHYVQHKALYEESLTTYDIPFVRFIANLCSLDPLMYEPELHGLEKMNEIDRRFAMNVMCRRLEQAVQYLMRSTTFDEEYIKNFIKRNNLYRAAYKGCQFGSKHYKLVSQLFAAHLSLKGLHLESGMIYKTAQMWPEALDQYVYALKWEQSLYLMNLMEYSKENMDDIMQQIINNLTEKREFIEVAKIYEIYFKNYDKTINVLIENGYLKEPMVIAHKYNMKDTIEQVIMPQFGSHKDNLISKMKDIESSFDVYLRRLVALRVQKTNTFQTAQRLDGDVYSDIDSVYSRTTTGTNRTSMSSRSRRKDERKKLDLREGGVYEDIALIRALYDLIVDAFKLSKEVRDTCLIAEDEVTFMGSRELQHELSTLLEKMRRAVPVIWRKELYEASNEPEVLAINENFQALDVKYKNPPSEEMVLNWTLHIFE